MRLADALEVIGLLNVQYAVRDGDVWVIEANPRASRTVPFVSKATGVPLAKVAGAGDARRDASRNCAPRGCCGRRLRAGTYRSRKRCCPFDRFPDVDSILGPEMRSTGEVMGVDRTFGMAFAQRARPARATRCRGKAPSCFRSPTATRRRALSSRAGSPNWVSRSQPPSVLRLHSKPKASPSTRLSRKVGEAVGVDAVDLISSGKCDLVINTPRGRWPRADGMHIRRAGAPQGPVRHNDRGRPRRRERHRRSREPRTRRALVAGVPPRQPVAVRGLTRRAHHDVDLPRRGRAALAAQSDHRRVGNLRPRRRGRRVVRPDATRCRHGEIARRVRVGREPAAARHRSARRRHAQFGRSRVRASMRGSRQIFPLEARGRVSSRRFRAGPSTTTPPRRRAPLKRSPTVSLAVEVNLSCPNVEARKSRVRGRDRSDRGRRRRGRRCARRRTPGVRVALTERHRCRRDRCVRHSVPARRA